MNSKKAQSEIITTVLITLLVLAAIIIVWQVVSSTMEKSKNQENITQLKTLDCPYFENTLIIKDSFRSSIR